MLNALRIGGVALALCAGTALALAQGNQPNAQQTHPTGTGESEVPGATRQTVPSTISAENAALDKLPTIAMQLQLTDEQKGKIAASLAKASAAPAGTVAATVSQSLPASVALQEFPAAATDAVPEIARYKYVKLPDRVLIVDPPFWIVVGEIRT